MLKGYALQIEDIIGGKVEWCETTKATRIVTLHSYDISNEAKWNDAFDWLINKALMFKKVTK